MHEVAGLIFDENPFVGEAAVAMVKSFLSSDFSPEGKTEVLSIVAQNLTEALYGEQRALDVLSYAADLGWFPDFDILNNVVSQVSKPSVEGISAESFIRQFLKAEYLADFERLKLFLAMEKQTSKRNSSAQEYLRGDGACEQAMN